MEFSESTQYLSVVREYHGDIDAVDLSNGVYVRLRGDGTGLGDDGRNYIEVNRPIPGTDDYEFLGYEEL